MKDTLFDYCMKNEDKRYLLDEWDSNKNTLSPIDVTLGSSIKVWWKCDKNHPFEAMISNRVKGTKCPYCSGRKVLKGFNDLYTTNPELIKEWDFDKNILRPDEVSKGSNKVVWWKCKKGHSFQQRISHRASDGSGCVICNNNGTSLPEIAIFICFKEIFKNTKNRIKINNIEYDICVPELNLLIEYDGMPWHEDREEKDRKKYLFAKNNGYCFLRIVEYNRNSKRKGHRVYNEENVIYLEKYPKMQETCYNIQKYISKLYNKHIIFNDLDSIEQRALEYSKTIERKNSLGFMFPEIAKEWNYEKNGKLSPFDFSSHSSYIVWWKCQNGHEWQAAIHSRTRKLSTGCPACSGNSVLIGVNDLKSLRPDLVLEWDYSKNKGKPEDYGVNSPKKVYWICKNGHSFQATVYQRTNLNYNCQYCQNKKVLKGFNDITITDPYIIKEWDYSKNENSPNNYLRTSSTKVYWVCDKGHPSYEQRINTHIINGASCPICSNQKVLKGYNDICTTDPKLLGFWDFERNKNIISPTEISRGSKIKVYWIVNGKSVFTHPCEFRNRYSRLL